MHDTVIRMLETAPKGPMIDDDALARCIEACMRCAQTCVACADACVSEDQVEMLGRCIRLNLDCADICESADRILSRQQHADAELLRRTLELCVLACRICAEECDKHAGQHEHCRICAASCRSCEQACHELLAALGQEQPAARH